MPPALMFTCIAAAVVLFTILILFKVHLPDDRLLTPMALFLLIDLVATLPPMLPTNDSPLRTPDGQIAILVVTGMLAFAIAFFVVGGHHADFRRWRGVDAVPDAAVVRQLRTGTLLLTGLLVGVAVFRFGGLPPMLTGGFASLLNPAENSEQVETIRETRRSLTKGATLLGEAYRGQGILNAFAETGWMMVVAAAALIWRWSRTPSSVRLLAGVGVLCFIFLGSAGARSPLIFAALAGVAAVTLTTRLRDRTVVAGALAFVAFVLFIMPLSKGAAGGISIEERVEAAWTRVTEGNGEHSAQIVNLVDSGQLDLGYGSIFIERTEAMLPGVASNDPFARRLTRMFYGGGENKTGYSTPTQFGLLYADGGMPGVLLGYVACGALVGIAWKGVLRIKSHVGAVLAAVSVVVLGHISISGVHGAIASAAIMLACAGILGLPTLAARRRRHRRRHGMVDARLGKA